MTALQSATKSLLTQLQNAVTTNGDVYVSIVPFVKDVNLDAPTGLRTIFTGASVAQDPKSDNSSWDAIHGSCSAGELFAPQHLPHEVDLLDLGLYYPEQLHRRRHLLYIGQ